MVEVGVKERVGDGEPVSFLAFELLSGVFKKELDRHAHNILGGTSTGAGLESFPSPTAPAPLIPDSSTSWACILLIVH